MEALLDNLSTPDWILAVKKDSNNHVQNLFFTHQKQVKLLLANPDVLLMDCTYRTNSTSFLCCIYWAAPTYRHSSLRAFAFLVMRHMQTTTGRLQTSSSRQTYNSHVCSSAIKKKH